MKLFDMEFVELLERVEPPVEVLSKYKDDPDVYISFTDTVYPRDGKHGSVDKGTTKVGINPLSHYDTPIGVYTYPLQAYWETIREYSSIPFAKEKPYIYVLKPKNPGQVAKSSTYTAQDFQNDKESLVEIFGNLNIEEMDANLDSYYTKNSLQRFMSLCRAIAEHIRDNSSANKSRVTVLWTQIMRRFYDGISDDTGSGIIHGNEPTQAVFWTLAQLKTLDVIDRKKIKSKYDYSSTKAWAGKGRFKKHDPKNIVKKSEGRLTEYDSEGREVQIYNTNHDFVELFKTYYPSGRKYKVQEGNNTNTYSDDDKSQLIESEDGDTGEKTKFEYWDNGILKTSISSKGRVMEYNPNGTLKYRKNPMYSGFQEEFYDYDDGTDIPTKKTEINSSGKTIKNYEKGQFKSKEVYDAEGKFLFQTLKEYWPNGNVKRQITDDGEDRRYNEDGSLIYKKDESGTVWEYVRWSNGNIKIEKKDGVLVRVANEQGNTVYRVFPSGTTAHHIYDKTGENLLASYRNGKLESAADEKGNNLFTDEDHGRYTIHTYFKGSSNSSHPKTFTNINPDPGYFSYIEKYKDGDTKLSLTDNHFSKYNEEGRRIFHYNRSDKSIRISDKDGRTIYYYDPDDNTDQRYYYKDGKLTHTDDYSKNKRIIHSGYDQEEVYLPDDSIPLYTKYIGLDDKIENFIKKKNVPPDVSKFGYSSTPPEIQLDESRKMKTQFDKEFSMLMEMYKGDEIDIHRAYELFRDEYMKSTGKAWSKDKFMQRAANWEFYGDQNGFIAVRPQKSGFVKFVGAAGSDKSKYKGFKELAAKNLPLWGMVDDKIAGLLSKLGFRGPNKLELFAFKKLMTPENMAAVLGGATIDSIDGSKVTMTYPDIGTVVKYFVAAPQYWKKIRGNII